LSLDQIAIEIQLRLLGKRLKDQHIEITLTDAAGFWPKKALIPFMEPDRLSGYSEVYSGRAW
jgi:hypothetical protein